MMHFLFFMISMSWGAPVVQTTPDKNFEIIDDFEKDKLLFKADTVNSAGQSTEGGMVVGLYNKDKGYKVVDIWVFGEMGKVHATYWLDKDMRFKIVKRTNYEYDKPFYEKGFKVTEVTEYLSYVGTVVRRYDAERKESMGALTLERKRQYEEFFREHTKGVAVVK